MKLLVVVEQFLNRALHDGKMELACAAGALAMDTSDKLKDARTHLRQAAQALEDRVLGADTANHLRQAARSVLQAGLAALDERCKKPSATETPPASDSKQISTT
jgi:hypothetical protein